jgi:hypothetical protein
MKTIQSLAWLSVLVAACGGSSGGTQFAETNDAGGSTPDGGPTGDDDGGTDDGSTSPDGSTAMGSNSVPMVVNNGPSGGGGSVDVPFISVTICIPGTTTCQTIDSVSVDTGSSGLRIISSVLSSNMALPQAMATTGSPMAECLEFGDGYTWGSVRYADVTIGGEFAGHIPLQLIGDPGFTSIPTDCSSSGPQEDTVADFGGNGLIGINQIVADCGEYCASGGSAGYYSCTGTTCTAVAVPVADQIANPIAAFATDNNGAVLQLPSVPDTGAATLTGSLTFGIATQSNNAMGSSVSVQTLDEYGDFTTLFNGKTMNESFVDSGTNTLSFDDSSITQCTGQLGGFYCPTSPVSLMAQNKGLNGVMTTVSFSVGNAETLFQTSDTALSNLGATSDGSNTSFDWGLPFFMGRTVFVGLAGASTPGGNGPFVAY